MNDIALFTSEGVAFLFRWIHLLAGVAWIGLLYYFNFVQVPFFAETDAPVRSGAIAKLVPRALWWFRWAAMATFLSGVVIIFLRVHDAGGAIMATSWGVTISLGALLGTVMFLNVWLVIWPNQKVVIASTQATLAGGAADPKAAAAGARAFVASRTNVIFSIPMLFFMGAASHLTLFGADPKGSSGVPMGIAAIVIALLEANCLWGKKGEGFNKALDKHVSVIHIGLALALVFYFLLDVML